MKINEYFGNYKKNNYYILKKYMSNFNINLKKYYNFGKPFFKGEYKLNYGEFLKDKKLNYDSKKPKEVFKELAPYFKSIPNYNNPGTMINVIPPVNLVSLAVSNIMNLYNPNFAQDTYAGMLINSELEVSKYLSELVGWDYTKSYGTFTFGGKGTNLYATKVALNKANKEIEKNGCDKNKYFMLTSKNGHPCHYEVCNWLGIGTNNCYEVNCNLDGEIDLNHAKEIIEKNIKEGKIFIGINLTAGSTNELYVDPIKKTYDLVNEIKAKYKLTYKPHIHADAVLGWVYLFFNYYNFDKNELNVDINILKKIKSLNYKIKDLKYVDSFGVDFHKTGFCNYISSIILFKNKNDYFTLSEKDNISLDELTYGNYNPYHSTLELTRSGNGPISALCALKAFGIKGYQEIVIKIFDSSEYFRKRLKENKSICIINENTEGLATFFIIKPKKFINMNLNDILKLNEKDLEYIKQFNINYGKYILNNAIKNNINFCYTVSRSYVIPNTNIKLGALKVYPMSVFLNRKEVNKIVKEIDKTIDKYIISNDNYMDYIQLSDDMVYREK